LRAQISAQEGLMETCQCGHRDNVHILMEGECCDQACDCQEFLETSMRVGC
jgi:hypothetical protein